MRVKPIRFGHKMWMLASNTVLLYPIKIYQGKKNGDDNDKLLRHSVVILSISSCANPSDHHVFFF